MLPSWSEFDRAYIAGLVDGEGCIHVSRNARGVFPAVTVAMTHHGVIAWLAERFGVKPVVHNKAQAARTGNRLQWRATATGARAATICRELAPFLRVKAPQALTVGEWPVDGRRGRGRPLDPEIELERDLMAEALESMNAGHVAMPAQRTASSSTTPRDHRGGV